MLKRRILTTFEQHIAKFGFLLNLLVLMIFWMYWIIYKMLMNNVKTRSVPSTAWMQSRGWRHQYLHSLIIFHRSFKYKSRSFRRFQAEKKEMYDHIQSMLFVPTTFITSPLYMYIAPWEMLWHINKRRVSEALQCFPPAARVITLYPRKWIGVTNKIFLSESLSSSSEL